MDEPKATDTELLVVQPKKRFFTIEPALMLLFLSFSLSSTIYTNQIIYQACTVKFRFKHDECELLGTHNASKDIETIVQPYAANILVARQLIESIVPGVLSLFLGPWSDRFGRKPVMMSSLFGYFVAICMSTVIAWLSVQHDINPWAYALASIPVALTGGLCGLLSSSLSYIADVASTSNRALRMSYVQAAIFGGMLIGNLSSSDLLRITSTAVVFSVSSVLTLLALMYVVFLVRESVHDQVANQRISTIMKFASLFDITLVSDVFRTCFRRRDNSERPVILLTMVSLIAGIFVMTGSETVFYMFAREKFQWTIGEYNLYDSTAIVTQMVGNIVGLYVLVKFFGISEVPMAILAYTSFTADYLVKAMATESWHMFAGLGIAFLKFIANPMCRSILANNVSPNEIGKIYGLTTAIESLSALVAAPLYSFVYQSTLSFYPGAFNMISAGVYGACVCVMILVKIIQKTHPRLATGISYGPITSD